MIKEGLLAAALLLASNLVGGRVTAGDTRQETCLAEALYYEARDQGWRGMLAVGVVIQNRVRDARYPDTICGVVKQGRYRNGNPVKHKCQFSYYCDGKPERPSEKKPWTSARDLSNLLLSVTVQVSGIEDATHYHAIWVNPSWAARLDRLEQIGGHVFYVWKHPLSE
tara:strand:- start:2274 stop:2774 length:501 start_codon:yes stop_codon:yes gene_type:complete